MRDQLTLRLGASRSLGDALFLVELVAIVLATWLLLGFHFDHAIGQADETWLVVPYTDSALHAGGDWTRHVYRFGVVGGSEMHAFGGMLPLVQLAAWLGLSTTNTVNIVIWFVQVSYAFFGIRFAEGLATAWAGHEIRFGAALRVVSGWLIAFAPLLGGRIAVGHENLLLGFLPFVVMVSLLWQQRSGRISGSALVFAAFAIMNGISGLGAQGILYSAVFGLPFVIASLWGWRSCWRGVAETIGVAAVAGLVMLPRLVPMVQHALGPDATRAIGTAAKTSYGSAPASDWLTSIGWTIGARVAGTVHEHSYPLGPIVLLVAAFWPRGTSRRLLWTLAATLAVVIFFASEVPPVPQLLHAAVPPLAAFRGPSRAAMAVVLLLPAIAVACWSLYASRDGKPSRQRELVTILAGCIAIALGRNLGPWPREVLAWLTALGACVLVAWKRLEAISGRVAAASVCVGLLGGLSVLAFDERIPRGLPNAPIEQAAYPVHDALQPANALERQVLPDAPAPFQMSLAFAARVPSIDGVWYPPRRFLALLSALDGRELPATTSVFRLSRDRDFRVLQQLYNVQTALSGLATPEPALQQLPPTPGAAWFPERVDVVENDASVAQELNDTRDLRSLLRDRAWVAAGDPWYAPGCVGARVDSATTDELGQSATIDVHVPAACTLVVATSYTSILEARARVGDTESTLATFPIDIALTGVAVPRGASRVVLGPRVDLPLWARLAPWLGLLLLGGLLTWRNHLRRVHTLAATALLCIVCAGGCKSHHEPMQKAESHEVSGAVAPAKPDARQEDKGPSLLIIQIDTMRADRLGVSGYRRGGASLTPNLDRFAATAQRFTHAYAQAANTPRSLPSILTSRLPSQIKFHNSFHNFPAVLDENVTLFEVLAGAGLHTASVSSHFYFEKRRNLGQGIADYDNSDARSLPDSNLDYAAPRIAPRVLSRLEALAASHQRFAMFVHLFEPHSTYIDHPEYPVTVGGEAGLAARYDYEIAIDDGWVGKILDALDRLELADHTVVVIVSDHGEAFGTHVAYGQRAFFHGQTLYDEILRVPLLMRIPGVKPAVLDDVVALIDVAPTVVEALGLGVPATFVGRSLLPRIHGTPLAARPVLAEIQPTPDLDDTVRALVSADGSEKIIVSNHDQNVEIYDLRKDPSELANLATKDRARRERLRAALEKWTDGLAP
jgi:hypothetical protein